MTTTAPAKAFLKKALFERSSAAVTVLAAIQSQIEENPENAALFSGDDVLTYRELNARSGRLAASLRARGVSNDVPVALCLPRSFDFVTAALAVWKAGGAYVPMDPAYPAERLAFILQDAQASVLITDATLAQRFPKDAAEIMDVAALDASDAAPPESEPAPGDLAYVIYTSGSTGTPKGVEITHAGLANLIAWHCDAFSVTSIDRASHVAGLGFDASVWELWPYLAAGAAVHLADDVTRSSPELLRDWIVAKGITIAFVPTPLAERIISFEWPRETALRMLLTGGDVLHHHPPRGLPFTFVNNYGPTESTVVATSGIVLPRNGAGALPSIGQPIANTRVYLLDEDLREVADGTPGEIHISSPGLARGYRNSPDLTAYRFIQTDYGRLYKTGDLGRRRPDGDIDFLGRIDDQIKIRGYRIEPIEITRILNTQPGIRNSVVTAREDLSGEKRLIAYVMPTGNSAVSSAELRASLAEKLPDYMIPSHFVRLDQFPLTAHGKIDYAALPAPDASNALGQEAPPAALSDTGKRVSEIVAALLELPEVGADENFFMLGGHSLLGAQLIARIRKDFKVQITLRTLFAAPTVAELSREIDRLIAKSEIAG